MLSSTGLSVLAANPVVFSNPINLSNDAFSAKEPNVQNVGSHVYASWTESSRGIYFRSSADNGTTWNPPFSSIAMKISLKGGSAQYPLIAAYGSNVYVVWSQSNGTGTQLQVFFTSSVNYGKTFSKPQVIDATPSSASITPVVAAYGTNVYVALIVGKASFVKGSSNNGTTWNPIATISNNHEPQLAALGNNAYAVADGGYLYTNNSGLTWHKVSIFEGSEAFVAAWGTNVVVAGETKGNNSVVKVEASHNSGVSFTTPFTVSASITDSWAPMVGVWGNLMYVAWRSNPGSFNSQEYVAVSKDAGVTWISPIPIGVGGRDNQWPFTIAISGNNTFIMWSEKVRATTTSPWQTLVSYSANNGSSWTLLPSLSKTPTSGAQPENDIATGAISTFSTHGFAVWQNNQTTPQVEFAVS
jgi:hypothetical protein